MKRDWNTFFQYSLRALKGSLVGLFLVPIFFFVFNPRIDKDSISGLLMSVRIGLEVVVVNLLVTTAVYAAIYQWSIPQMIRLKESVKFRFAIGFSGMTLGLLTASYIEPTFGGTGLNIQGITIGLTIGGITYLAFILKSAYTETQSYNLKLRAESAESNLNVLKNQMQPHFLFNSLNSLAELIDSNREYASQMTQKLSDLYREILESSKQQVSSLESEISIVKKYLELEALRFGHRLKYDIEVPENIENTVIPSLLLQTLVENSVKHGVSQSLEGGFVSLKIFKDKEGFIAKIDNTAPKKTKPAESTGTGLANTIARLDLLYGPKHNFKIETIDGRTMVHFWFSGVS